MPKEAESETSPPSSVHCNADAAPEQKGGVLQPSARRTPAQGLSRGDGTARWVQGLAPTPAPPGEPFLPA